MEMCKELIRNGFVVTEEELELLRQLELFLEKNGGERRD
jgi:hypothetical protein